MQPHASEAPRPQPTGCCAPFDPTPWQDQEVTWKDKLFLKTHVPALLHIPIGMDRVMTRAMNQIRAADALAETGLMLADERSAWGTDLYIDVTRPVPGATMETLSGTFLTRVYEGPYSHARAWAADMTRHVAVAGRTLEQLYFAYTTCPACAKAYGKNYVVVLARVAASEAARRAAITLPD